MIGNKLVVYLDQFAISNMVDAKEGDIWCDVKKAIEKYHSDGKIICPMSAEHVLETSQRDFERAGMQDNFFWKISDGYTFWNFSYIIAGQICELIKNEHLHTFFLKHNPNWDLSQEESYNIINLLFGIEKKDINQNFDSFSESELNKIAKNKILHFDEYKKEILKKILECNDIDNFIQKIAFTIKDFDSLKQNPILLIDISTIILCLVVCFQFSKRDFINLQQEINEFGVEHIDSLSIKIKLNSYLNVNGGNTNINDVIDCNRIATGLPYSDILFCDKKYKRYIIKLGLNKRYDAKIFSGTNEDLKYFLNYLDNIIIR